MQELTPPDLTKTPNLVLEAPQPIEHVEKDDANQMVKLDESKIPELDAKVNE